VVEVRYLYAFKESNALYQPVYLGPRKDVEVHECVLSQLKYKANDSDGSDES
jgi:bifunctional non-homologous end joining protein LigD